jgi:hypothetical protein
MDAVCSKYKLGRDAFMLAPDEYVATQGVWLFEQVAGAARKGEKSFPMSCPNFNGSFDCVSVLAALSWRSVSDVSKCERKDSDDQGAECFEILAGDPSLAPSVSVRVITNGDYEKILRVEVHEVVTIADERTD